MIKEKYTHEQMDKVFKLVQNKRHWKLPIDCVVKLSTLQVDIAYHAIIYFTGSVPNIVTKRGGKYRVQAAGYYAAIGA